MGIGSLVSGGLSLVGGILGNKSNDKATRAQTNASNQATALSREQFERGIKEVAPFRQLGIDAIPGLTAAANRPVEEFNYRDPGAFLNEYFNSPEFQALNSQATDQILRNRSATGGFRSGGSNVDLANIAPTLGIGALQRINQQDASEYSINEGARADNFNRLNSVVNMGANVSSGNQVAGGNFASQAGNNAMNAGNAIANGQMNRAGIINDTLTGVGSAYLGNKMGLFNFNNAAGGSAGDYTGTAYQNWAASQGGKI